MTLSLVVDQRMIQEFTVHTMCVHMHMHRYTHKYDTDDYVTGDAKMALEVDEKNIINGRLMLVFVEGHRIWSLRQPNLGMKGEWFY